MYQVIKRNGRIVNFDIRRIMTAMQKAFTSVGKEADQDVLELLALRVTADFQNRIHDGQVSVEDIQDSVERVLSQAGYEDVAKSYILYRKNHENVRNAEKTMLDYKKTVDGYLKALDWRVKENSTVTYSVGGLILSNSGAVTANYWLSQIYDKDIADAHRNGDFHIHDLSMLTGYCAGWSLKQLLLEGLGGIPGKITSKPAKHLSTLCNQMVNFLGIMQNEWAGAQAFSSFDTYLAPFVRTDHLNYEQVKKCIESFIYGVNTPSRWGCVDTETEVLSTAGFKKYNELKEGDVIFTWKDGRLEENTVRKVVVKPYKGVMHSYKGRGYHQFVTPTHRMLAKRSSRNEYEIIHSEDVFLNSAEFSLPAKFEQAALNGVSVTDEEVMAAAVEKNIDDIFLRMNSEQSKLFIDTWMQYNGEAEENLLQYDAEDIRDALQLIALRAGFTTYLRSKNKTNYVHVRKTSAVSEYECTEVPYDGLVWCPNVENGTAVFRKDGTIFISGQTQAPFTNVTLDWVVPNDLADLNAIVGGKEMDFTYGDCQKEMDMVNRAFIEVMIEGDANGRGFQYPIPTYSITKDFDWSDTENNRLLFSMTAKYGTPYFSNYINSDMEPSDVRSMCCRLRLDLRELRRKAGGFFGSGESTGSVGVVTINLPRIAYLSKTPEEFYKRLDHLMDLAARSLKIKRRVITQLLDKGLYPYTKHYLGSFDNHFSTIGLVGMNEACLNAEWLRKDLGDPAAQKFAKDVLNHMRSRLVSYQEQYGDLYNLEATPAESTAYRLAKHDKERFPDIITASKDDSRPYYTNSSHLPVGYTDDVFEALDIQDDLQTLYTSGTVFHAFLGEKLPTWKSAAKLVRTIAENYKLPYFTISPTYSICQEHGYITGEAYKCPICGKPTEVWSRITGYYRPVSNWNDGKAQEWKQRKTYAERRSHLKKVHVQPKHEEKNEQAQNTTNKAEISGNVKLYLFTTPTCPNCRIVKDMLKNAGADYELIDATKNIPMAQRFTVMTAPTLIAAGDSSYKKYAGIPEIRKGVAELQKK